MAEQHPGALSDIRVLEITDEKGQYCGKLLAEAGADIIKLEPPGGAAERRIGPFVDDVPNADRSLYFWHYNTNKRGITVNIETPQGRQIVKDLARRVDVVVESTKPGYLDRLGLGWSVLSELNPRLIMCSITPYGQTGPWRDFVTSDLVAMAGGPLASNGYDHLPDQPPSHALWDNAYQTGCHFAYIGILVAIFDRDRTGLGQYLDSSIHEANACTTEGAFPQWEYSQQIVLRQTGRHAAPTPSLPWQFLCKDGIYVNLMGSLPRSQQSWVLLRQWMEEEGKVGDLNDEQYADITKFRGFGARSAEIDHIVEMIGAFVVAHTAEEIFHGGQSRGMPWSVVRSPDEALHDPHWEDRGFWGKIYQPQIGREIRYQGAPYKLHDSPWALTRVAPTIGEHNAEVLNGELGISKARLVQMAEAGII